MIGPMKYVTAGLGGLSVVLAITCGIMWWKLDANAETITALRGQLKTETAEVVKCGETLQEFRDEVDEKNAEIVEHQETAAESLRVQAEADRLAQEVARAKRRLDEIAAEREAFVEQLAELPRCEKYLATLMALAGGGS